MSRRAVVVDDERLARVELKALLASHPGVVVVGEAASVSEAEAVLAKVTPDLLFLDIQLGADSGFTLLERIPLRFDVVFVTAFDEHAVRAFEVNATDYLLKPVNPERLAATLRRLEAADPVPTPAPAAGSRLRSVDRLFVRTGERWRFLPVNGIAVIEARGDYSRVRTRDGETLLLDTAIREWERTLPDHLFVRIHRSTIVNMDEIERVEEWSGQTFHVHLRGRAEPYPMSRRYAARLRR